MVVVVVVIAKKVKKLLVPYIIVYCYLTYFIYDVTVRYQFCSIDLDTIPPKVSKEAKTAVDIISVAGGVQRSFHYGEAPPRSPTVSKPLVPFYILFSQKSYSFNIYLLLTN